MDTHEEQLAEGTPRDLAAGIIGVNGALLVHLGQRGYIDVPSWAAGLRAMADRREREHPDHPAGDRRLDTVIMRSIADEVEAMFEGPAPPENPSPLRVVKD